MQMLIIGEDPHVRQLLKAEGIAAVADETGLQALDLLETAPYSLVVVCDGSLPGADALSFIRRIRRDFPRARVFILVVTDAEAREKRAAFLSAGTDDFLYKPFSGMELSDKLRLGARIAALESKTAGSPEVAAGPVDISGLLMRLLPGVVHEINNPTGFVSGNLSTMEGYVKDIAEQFHRLMDLRAVLSCRSDLSPGEKKLLDVCKSHADRIDLEFVLSDITALLNESREGMTRIQALTHA
ncbi:MAG: response regulator, partial [Thermodesulfobacteriota bacterium]